MISTLTAKFEEIAKDSSDKVSIVMKEDDTVSKLTYGQIYNSSLKVANWLCMQGTQKGDRIAIALENCPEWCICYFGLLFSGAIAIPLDFELGSKEIKYFLEQTQTKIIFASEKLYLEDFKDLNFLQKIVIINKKHNSFEKSIGFSEILKASLGHISLPRIEPEDLASIIFTSGTTGHPKGVMLTHKNFFSNFSSISKLNIARSSDNFLSILPLHHSFPFLATLIVPLFSQARITYIKTLKPEVILKCLREEEITILAVTPQVLQLFYSGIEKKLKKVPLFFRIFFGFILNLSWMFSERTGMNPAKPLLSRFRSAMGPKFRYFVSGGAKLDEELARSFFRLGFKILEGYGLTETAPVVSINLPKRPKIGSVGKALPDVNIKILNPDEKEVGQILIKGSNVMKGYYKNERETQETIKNGWFYSGDLGYLDSEGYLFIKERLKEIIVLSSGKNISADEVEKYYQQAPSVKEICVLPDSKQEKLVAVIVPDLTYLREIGEPDIQGRVKWDLEYFSERLSPYKRIKGFFLLNEELPKTRLGKIKRHEVKKIYEERFLKGIEKKKPLIEEDLSETGRKVIDILLKKTGERGISLNDHIELDLGIDSLGRVELMTALEEKFTIDSKEEEFMKLSTVFELINYIEEESQEDKKQLKVEKRSWESIISSKPPQHLLDKITIIVSRTGWFFTLFASLIFDPLFKLFFRLKVYGRENLLKDAIIICPNHTSYLDGFVLFSSLPLSLRYHLFFIGFREYFEFPVIRNLIKLIKVIPLSPSKNLVETMQLSSFVLKNGKILCIFPEGARSISGEIKEFKKGAAILAKELGVKVVPAYISGTKQALKRGTWFPKPYPIKVIFGRYYLFGELKEKGLKINSSAEDYEAISIGLREEVLSLKKELEAYQG